MVTVVASVTKFNDMHYRDHEAASQRLRQTMLQSQSMWFRYDGSGLELQGDERSEYRPAPHPDRADIDSGPCAKINVTLFLMTLN